VDDHVAVRISDLRAFLFQIYDLERGVFTAHDEASKVANIACPVYGFYGENDERVNGTIPKAEELMKAAGKKYEPVIYKGAGHGFMRSGEPANPNMREGDKKAREDAWARWKALLKQLSL